MKREFKIGDEVIISERATINARATGKITHINQQVQIYEVSYDIEQALTKDLRYDLLSYPYFENEIKLNITKIRDKILRDILKS